MHLGLPHALWVHKEQLLLVPGNTALAGLRQNKLVLQTDCAVTESTLLCTATMHTCHNHTEDFQTCTNLVRAAVKLRLWYCLMADGIDFWGGKKLKLSRYIYMKHSQRVVVLFVCLFSCKNCLSLAQNSYHWFVEQTNTWQHQQNFFLRSVLLLFGIWDFPLTSRRPAFMIVVTRALLISWLLGQ